MRHPSVFDEDILHILQCGVNKLKRQRGERRRRKAKHLKIYDKKKLPITYSNNSVSTESTAWRLREITRTTRWWYECCKAANLQSPHRRYGQTINNKYCFFWRWGFPICCCHMSMRPVFKHLAYWSQLWGDSESLPSLGMFPPGWAQPLASLLPGQGEEIKRLSQGWRQQQQQHSQPCRVNPVKSIRHQWVSCPT